MSPAFEARIIGEAAELAALEPEWWDLWRRAPAATPFQSPAWLIPWWEAFAPGRLHVVAIGHGGRLVGLAPLYLEEGRRRLLPIGISVSDYLDVLLDPEAEGAREALASALAASGAWTQAEFAELRPDAAALRLPCPPGCAASTEQGETCPFLLLPAEPEQLRSALPHRKRRSLSLDRNRAERRGAVRIQSLADMPAQTLLAELIRLHGLRWESRGEAGVLSDPRVLAFHQDALPRLAAAHLARLYALRIGDAIAAAYYGFLHGPNAYAYLTGIDPGFIYESPGTLLMAHAMQEAIREGAREFHFLRGGEAYKYGWGAQDRWNQRRVFSRRVAHAAE